MLSCYDYPATVWAEKAGVDIILVGDSVGVKILGYESPEQVTMEDMLHHFKAVQRACNQAYLIADLPLSSYKKKDQALIDSKCFVDHGANAVKIETFDLELVKHLVENQIEVCVDIIYSMLKTVLEKEGKDEITCLVDTVVLEKKLKKAGASTIVFTFMPEEAAKAATSILTVPTIGVGSGRYSDGQVLIAVEMLGMCETFGDGSYNKKYTDFQKTGQQAVTDFVQETKEQKFPAGGHFESLDRIVYDNFKKKLANELGS